MVIEGKNKKRKISDFFTPLPKKVTCTQHCNESKVASKATSIQLKISCKPVRTSKTQSTQTDFFEMDSNEKEGLKFLAERIYNFEAIRIHGNYDLCSIADKRSYPKNDQGIINEAHYNLDIIQENETIDSQHAMKSPDMSQEKIADANDKMTCWGEENPSSGFLDGMKMMAYRIRKTELSRLDYDEFTTDWQFDWSASKPIDLVNEVADTMVGMRKLKALLNEEDQFSDLDVSF